MAYCTKDQVADEFNGSVSFGVTTSPTATTVDRWIAEADVLIDAKVGLRYDTPITDPTDLILIRMISVLLVSARVRKRLNRTGPDNENAKVKVSDSMSEANKMLNDIVKGLTNLPGSSLANSEAGVSSYTVGLEDPHTFKKGEDQW